MQKYQKFEILDPCKITVFNYDATSEVKKQVKKQLEKLEDEIDKQIEGVDLKAILADVWKQLQQPITLDTYGYMYLFPKSMAFSEPRFSKDKVSIDLNLGVAPIVSTNKQEVKELMGLEYGFTAGATYPTPSYKMYNEVDSLKNKRFAMQNLDINDESNYFQSLINIIADNTAKHTHSFTLSHFYNPIGGWDSYLGRTDSLLAWCKLNDI